MQYMTVDEFELLRANSDSITDLKCFQAQGFILQEQQQLVYRPFLFAFLFRLFFGDIDCRLRHRVSPVDALNMLEHRRAKLNQLRSQSASRLATELIMQGSLAGLAKLLSVDGQPFEVIMVLLSPFSVLVVALGEHVSQCVEPVPIDCRLFLFGRLYQSDPPSLISAFAKSTPSLMAGATILSSHIRWKVFISGQSPDAFQILSTGLLFFGYLGHTTA